MIQYGSQTLELKAPDGVLVGVKRQPAAAPLADQRESLAAALETPHGYPALRRALTPDDHVTIIADAALPDLPSLLRVVIDHVASARVRPEAITVLLERPLNDDQANALRAALDSVRVVIHDAADRRQLSYLATTRKGRRIYLNRNVVDADQVVVLAGRRFDPLLGYSGAEGAIYPALSDQETLQDLTSRLSMLAPEDKPWPVQREAIEVAWLLGAPFMVQCIEGPGKTLCHIIAGTAESGEEGLALLNARWRAEVDRLADLVIASVDGEGAEVGFEALAAALATASRVVQQGGQIALLSAASPNLGSSAQFLRDADSPTRALKLIRERPVNELQPAFLWASAAHRAHLYLLTQLPQDTAEELFVTPFDHGSQVQRLLTTAKSCVILPNADLTMAVVKGRKEHRAE
jgi:nickel-dependent lactate racemase